jgi:hypothetical protein
MNTHHYTYAAARDCFLSLARPLALNIESHVHPLQGPDGEIAMDIATFGKADASNVLVMTSGTHGVEGYCGSFIQCEFLHRGLLENLPEDFCLVMIHGVNPYGFAWQRRVNEDNIDLNRNFIDHDHGARKNTGYVELSALLEPKIWDDASTAAMWQQIFAIANQHDDEPGWQAMAITSGQTDYPNGVFYAGQGPAWSNLRIREFVTRLKGKHVAWLDIHTALGAYGEAECIVEYSPDSAPLKHAHKLWGDRVRNTKTNESLSADIAGSMGAGAHETLGDDLVFCGLEYGTVKSKQVLEAVIADQWLHRYGDLASAQGQAIKQQMMDAFYPDDPNWRASVFTIALDVIKPILATPLE